MIKVANLLRCTSIQAIVDGVLDCKYSHINLDASRLRNQVSEGAHCLGEETAQAA